MNEPNQTQTTPQFTGKEILSLAKACADKDRFNIHHLLITPNEIVTTNGHFLTAVIPGSSLGVTKDRYLESNKLKDLRVTDLCEFTDEGMIATSKRGNKTVFSYTEASDICYPDVVQVMPVLRDHHRESNHDAAIGGAAYSGYGIDVLGKLFSVISGFGLNAIKFCAPDDALSPSVVMARRDKHEIPLNIYGVVMPLRLDGNFLDLGDVLRDRLKSAA